MKKTHIQIMDEKITNVDNFFNQKLERKFLKTQFFLNDF
jgi:hypothetical protein